jgi:hypothetical protein
MRKAITDVVTLRGWFVAMYAIVFSTIGCVELASGCILWFNVPNATNESRREQTTFGKFVAIEGFFNAVVLVPAVLLSIIQSMGRRKQIDVEAYENTKTTTSCAERCLSLHLMSATFLIYDAVGLWFWSDVTFLCSVELCRLANVASWTFVTDMIARLLFIVAIPLVYGLARCVRYLGLW